MVLALALAAALSAAPSAAPEPITVIVGATLVDAGGRAPVADSVIVLRGAAIATVGDRMRTAIPKGAALLDGRRLWVAPAPPTAVPAAALLPAIAEILRGPAARLVPGQPAHVALLAADPRAPAAADAASPVRRVWISGKVRDRRD
jgi:hypothetical protein